VGCPLERLLNVHGYKIVYGYGIVHADVTNSRRNSIPGPERKKI
jgi:hypothetical protein